MKIDRKIAVFIAALAMIPLAAVGLSGCAPSTGTTPAASGTANSQSESPKPSESAAPIEVGAVIKAGAVLPDNQSAYPLSDGTNILVQKDKPLPAVVLADIQVQATAVSVGSSNPSAAGGIGQSGASLGEKVAGETGKQVLVIVPVTASLSLNDAPGPLWTVVNHKAFHTEAEAETFASQFIASQSAPAEWLVVTGTR